MSQARAISEPGRPAVVYEIGIGSSLCYPAGDVRLAA